MQMHLAEDNCTMREMYTWLGTEDIPNLILRSRHQIDVFCTNLSFFISQHQKKNKHMTENFIKKLLHCLEQVNGHKENVWAHRKYIIHEESDFLAAVKNTDKLPNVVIPLALERRDGLWYIASSDTFKKGRDRIILALHLSQ